MTGREFFRANAGGVAVFTFHTDHKNQEKGFNITFKFTEGGKYDKKMFSGRFPAKGSKSIGKSQCSEFTTC